MDDIAVLVLEQDAQARAIVSRCSGAVARTPAEAKGAPCDVALCTLPEKIKALADAAAGIPLLFVAADENAHARARDAGATSAIAAADATDAFVSYALAQAASLNNARASLAASFEELEQQRSELLQLSTLKSDLVATLAHDIKGPLTSIIGFAELMEEGFLEGADAVDAARTIRSNAQRLAALANDILALSRVEHGELEIADDRVNLRDVITQCVQEVLEQRPVELEIEPSAAYVRGDAERLRQVFDNLLRNAIKYSPGGEPVRVEVTSSGADFRIRVIDKGIGVARDEMGKLFQRFGRTSNARKAKIAGTGVGLFIVKTIVERHGGNVGVESTLGAGSTFTVSLPALEGNAPAPHARVAVITPDARLRRFTAYELRARGFRALEAASFAEAVEKVRDDDVVLVDGVLGDAPAARAALGADRRIVGVGVAESSGWDATLNKPFLMSDLFALLADRALARQ